MSQNIAKYSQFVMPDHINVVGTLFGGQMIAWIDLAAAKVAHRLLKGSEADGAVTRTIEQVEFKEPVYLGDWVNFTAKIVAAGTTSIHIEVNAYAEGGKTDPRLACSASLVMVSVKKDEKGKYKNTLMVKLLSSGVIFTSTLVFCQVVDSLKVDELLTKSVESKVVEISAIISYDSFEPRAFKLSLYPRKSPSEVYISRMFFPGDSIQIILPYNILSEDTLGNIASLEPVGGSYEKLYRLFTKSEKKIDLGNFRIKIKSDIIKLSLIDGFDFKPISKALLQISSSSQIIFSAMSDSMGYTRLRIPINRDNTTPVVLRVDTDGRYPPWQENLEIPKGVSSKTIPLYPMQVDEGVSIYKVVKELSPLRKGPENGSETLFLLNSGDLIAVNKVAGDRVYGRVRIDLYNKQSFKYFEGWVLHKDIKLMNGHQTKKSAN